MTVDGMPVCYGGDGDDSDYEDPRDIITRSGYYGFFPDVREDQSPVSSCDTL